MKMILSLFSVLLVLVIIALGSGAYNMAATEKHWAVTEKIIEWVRESSIEARARNLEVPSLDDKERLLKGAVHYDSMCPACHLAPGLKPTELSTGLYPQPPIFHQRQPVIDPAEKQARAREYFWVIKNGLKMTAMPAWGLSHDDDSIWAMTAFILEMGRMTPEQYQKLVHSAKDHAHTHDHEHSGH
ncbi:MAG: cytochrome c [Betaproteobacteria bacterium]|nr:cytochrome c [Betaproteobacteria bacterium]